MFLAKIARKLLNPHLLPIVHTLSCVLQTTTVSCPGALVWYPPTDLKSCGSPLDLLPYPPSCLPLSEIPAGDIAAFNQDLQPRFV